MTIGCIVVIALCFIMGRVVTETDGDSQESGKNLGEEKIIKNMGPDNPTAIRIRNLHPIDAYSAGMIDGSREAMAVSARMHWLPYDYQEKLSEFRDVKSQLFEVLATQNNFNPVVFEQYKNGWDRGAASLNVHNN